MSFLQPIRTAYLHGIMLNEHLGEALEIQLSAAHMNVAICSHEDLYQKLSSEDENFDVWTKAGVRKDVGAPDLLRQLFSEVQNMIANASDWRPTTLDVTLNPDMYLEADADLEKHPWSEIEYCWSVEGHASDNHQQTIDDSDKPTLTFFCSSRLYADLIYALSRWTSTNTDWPAETIAKAKRYNPKLSQAVPLVQTGNWTFSKSCDDLPALCCATVLKSGAEASILEECSQLMDYIKRSLETRSQRISMDRPVCLDRSATHQLATTVLLNARSENHLVAEGMESFNPQPFDASDQTAFQFSQIAMKASRSSFAQYGRAFSADLQRLSITHLLGLVHYVSELDDQSGISKTDRMRLHEEGELCLFERRSGFSADELEEDVSRYAIRLHNCLQVGLGIHAVAEALETLWLQLSGSSLLMRRCRCYLAITLVRAYERQNTNEAWIKGLKFMKKAFEDFEALKARREAMELTGASNITLSKEEHSLEKIAGLHSAVAELFVRARLFVFKQEITDPDLEIDTVDDLVKYCKSWALFDYENDRLSEASWKMLFSVYARREQDPTSLSRLDVESLRNDLQAAFKLNQFGHNARNLEPEFEKEYLLCSRAIDGVLKAAIFDYSISQREQLAATYAKGVTEGEIRHRLKTTQRTVSYTDKDLLGLNQAPTNSHIALRLLSAANRSLTEFQDYRSVNPTLVINQLIESHGEFCRAYIFNIWVFNLRYIHHRPKGWVFICVEGLIKHVTEIFRLRQDTRRKNALTFGLRSYQNQMKMMESSKHTFGMDIADLLGWCYMFAQWLQSYAPAMPRIAKLCWDIWALVQYTKADSLGNLISTRRLLPPAFLLSAKQADPELGMLLEAERDMLERVLTAGVIKQPIVLHELSKIRQSIALLPSAQGGLRRPVDAPMDNFAIWETFRNHPFLADRVLVDWVHVKDCYSLCVMRANELLGPLLHPIPQVSQKDVTNWLESNSNKEDLVEEEALSDLQVGLSRLVAPLSRLTKAGEKLILCPTGPLHDLPIHALLIDGQTLIDRNPLIYCHSFGMLRHCVEQFGLAQHAQYKATVFGDPSGTKPGKSGASEAATAISKNLELQLSGGVPSAQHHYLFPGARLASVDDVGRNLETTALYGKDVNKMSFKSHIQDSTLVHYHGHCEYGSADPLQNGLQLSDGLFSTQEAFDMLQLTCAPLVTLVACASGRQVIQISDEPLGIVPAFLYGGAGAVLSTLWPILDRDGAKFSELFYSALLHPECRYSDSMVGTTHLNADKSRKMGYADLSLALQRTIRQLRELGPEFESLYHWGSFRITGCPLVRIPVADIATHGNQGKDSFEIHGNVECDGCGMTPLKGTRWINKSRPDYDLCGTCVLLPEFADQGFESITMAKTIQANIDLMTKQYSSIDFSSAESAPDLVFLGLLGEPPLSYFRTSPEESRYEEEASGCSQEELLKTILDAQHLWSKYPVGVSEKIQ